MQILISLIVLQVIDKIKHREISLAEAKNNEEKFKSYLGEIRRGNSKSRSKEPKNALYNIGMLYKARNKAIKLLYDDYSSMVTESKPNATKET